MSQDFIRVADGSPYLVDGAGAPFIPVGLNLCFPRFVQDPAEGLSRMQGWISRLADAGGNVARIFLGDALLEIEPERCGVFSSAAEERLAAFIAHAARCRVRLILVLEHFRGLHAERRNAPAFPGAARFDRPAYLPEAGGPCGEMAEVLDTPAGRALYQRRLEHLATRFGTEPAILAWELWNEMNCVRSGDFVGWTKAMVDVVRRLCPRHLVMQSWGSLDGTATIEQQRAWAALPGLDVVQVHRYLDPGAQLPICQSAMDVLSADAITALRPATSRPILLGEGGAVEAHHAGPWKLYEADCAGSLLHDVLFAPFAAGSCGSGLIWHWDFYVERHDLWYHHGRFARAVAGFDPRGCRPERRDQAGLHVHALCGPQRAWMWVRDLACDWRSEIEALRPAPLRSGLRVDLGGLPGPWRVYDPWQDRWSDLPASGVLPDFRRSCVLRCG
jgi:hypothetical protein